MTLIWEMWEELRLFLDLGGPVLLAIFVTTAVMWTLILERLWYFRRNHPSVADAIVQRWENRSERSSWHAEQIRRLELAQAGMDLSRTLPLLATLIAVCPLLGLLGTVTGMIDVFDVMALASSANPRALASGVSRATIPTMAGMVAALSGLYFNVRLRRTMRQQVARLDQRLLHD